MAALVIFAAILLLIPILVLIVRAAKKRSPEDLKRHAGGFAVMYSLFFSFGRFFGGGPDYIEVAKDPAWKKRPENGDPPSPPEEKD